ncbi:MAG: RES family NAD+ phosphorylase [Bacteroidia bacterium]|nr:RES family NAD+ phosphorylase [Bacteroidia bacterium]
MTKYSTALFASGNSGRWNSNGKFVVYCSENRSLACLENLVQRNFNEIKKNLKFSLLEIEIPSELIAKTVSEKKLSLGWKLPGAYDISQPIGDNWYNEKKHAVLKVPTALIPNEFNYVINTLHPEFNKIKIKAVYSFEFDNRLKT